MTKTSKSRIIACLIALIATSAPIMAFADQDATAATGNPEKLAIYYGNPAAVNNATSITAAADTFKAYDMVIFGEGIEQSSHLYHATTQSVMQALPSTTRVYGYVDLCVQNPQSSLYRCSNFSQADLQSRVSAWKAMGAKGIFLDQAGCDYVVSRDRFNATVDYVHSQGLSAFVNVWNVPEAFEPGSVPSPYAGFADCNPNRLPTKLGSNDYELLESYGLVLSEYSETWAPDPAATMRRGQQMMNYKAQYGTKAATVNTVGYNNPPFDQAKSDWVWWMTSLFGLDAMSWGETWVYSSDTNALPLHARPTPNLGASQNPSAVTTVGSVSTRRTTLGTVRVDTSNHTGSFTSSGTTPTTTPTTRPSTTIPPTTVPVTTPTTRPPTTLPSVTTSTTRPPTTLPSVTTTTTKPVTTTTKPPTTPTTKPPTTTTIKPPTTFPPTNGWVNCAVNGKKCSVSGRQQVRYGAGSYWSTKTVTGSVQCNKATFGDPNPGVTKTCQRNTSIAQVGPFTGIGFTQCAGEGGRCLFSGTKEVVFGNSGWYSTRTLRNGADCNAAVFGDPLPGTYKVCWFR